MWGLPPQITNTVHKIVEKSDRIHRYRRRVFKIRLDLPGGSG